MKKILVVTPSFPAPESGAEQMDRADGIRQLVRLGHDVHVIAKTVAWADEAHITHVAKDIGVQVTLVPYRFSNRTLSTRERLAKFFGRLRNPLYVDGAAYEYAEPRIQKALVRELAEFKPDIVWFEYTYLWPLYAPARASGARIITRSINYEPQHFLDEDGRTAFNFLKYIPKLFSERRSMLGSDMVLAITPNEASMYADMGVRQVLTLPLRSLPRYVVLPRHANIDRTPLHVCFMGSSYKVAHNCAAAAQVITELAPEIARPAPGQFIFHIFGGKLPQELLARCDGVNVIYEGYVQDLDTKLAGMDIALIPSLMGAGMQQKVFEPMTRGIPTITSPRAIAGYPFEDGKEYLGAHTTEEFVEALLRLRPLERRETLARAASQKTAELFSQAALDATVQKAVYDANNA